MTHERFRRLALSFPDTIEGAHMGHPDFRVSGRIFATLHDDLKTGMVKLTPEQQELFVREHAAAFCRERRLGTPGVHARSPEQGRRRGARRSHDAGLSEHAATRAIEAGTTQENRDTARASPEPPRPKAPSAPKSVAECACPQ
jgi:hypothetical protein